MKKQIKDPFDGLVLDEYEQAIEDSVVADGDYFSISNAEKDDFAKIAKMHNHFQVSKRINIRINNQDLAKVKSKAKHNNIPYQTLISSIVHKYANGEIGISL